MVYLPMHEAVVKKKDRLEWARDFAVFLGYDTDTDIV